MQRVIRTLQFIILLVAVQMASAADFASEEVYRIRVQNKPAALVQVSMDRGETYSAVGRVRAAANARIIGFVASSYIPDGTVAATAVHGIRIKTGQLTQGSTGKAQMPVMFSLTPAEFSEIPKGYGGHNPRSSGILTDIYTGHSIFRNLSPYVGNPVFIERNRNLQPIPDDYTPTIGDTFVIVVKRPSRAPAEIEFENRSGGNVIVRYADGTSEVIAQVDRAVQGVGRYDGTSFTGVGAVNTNHGGVITISTAPINQPGTHEGGPTETRGGFMVQPYYHVHDQGEGAVQVMVIGPKDKTKPILEGTPPLFNGFINLSWFPSKPEYSYRAQVKIDDGEWEGLPRIVGRVDNAFTADYLQKYFQKQGQSRSVSKGVTSIKLVLPKFDAAVIAKDLKQEANDYSARAIKAGMKPKSGVFRIHSAKLRNCTGVVTISVDGSTVCCVNSPYTFNWNSKKAPNGLHVIDMTDENGELLDSMQVLVKN